MGRGAKVGCVGPPARMNLRQHPDTWRLSPDLIRHEMDDFDEIIEIAACAKLPDGRVSIVMITQREFRKGSFFVSRVNILQGPHHSRVFGVCED